ncbi:ankyrin repeat-containing domain protein [Obelidium mucronatum]|nr:ankyrin repeat-containing domain protein [Obelidium mucronatum]
MDVDSITSKFGRQALPNMDFSALPAEVIEIVLAHLPINRQLTAVGLSSRSFYSFIFLSHSFARKHYLHQLQTTKSSSIWIYMQSAGLFDQEWAGLPLNYQTTLYSELLRADMPQDHESDDLINPERWNLNPTRALEIMQSLLHQTENYNSSFSPCCQLNRPIHWAVINGHTEVDEDNLLLEAVSFGRVGIVEVLLKDSRIDPTSNDNVAFQAACEEGSLESVKLLLAASPSVDPSMDNNLPIRIASRDGNSELIKFLLSDPRVDPTANNHEALLEACTEAHTEATMRVDPAADRHKAFLRAMQQGFWDIMQVFLEDSRVDPSVGENLALRTACRVGHLETVKILLNNERVDAGARYNEPIRVAAGEGHFEVVELLLASKGVDPAAENNDAIRAASKWGREEAVALLLDDPRVDPSDGDNYAIISAATEAWPSIVEMLLSDPRVDPSANGNEALRGAMDRIKVDEYECSANWEVIALLLNDARTTFENDSLLKSELGCLEVMELLANKIQ